MSNEKTTFRPLPGGGGDRTVMRSRSAGSQTEQIPAPLPNTGMERAIYAEQQPDSTAQKYSSPVEAASLETEYGLNPLVQTANTLLTVFQKVRQTINHPDISGLHMRLSNELKSFERRAKEQGIPPQTVLAAHYILCSVLDEAVLNTPWGAESAWMQKTLLRVFHNETSGGEKFFTILDRMRTTPAQNLAILELIYICLSMGFEGKYRLMDRGRDSLEQIRDDLFSLISRHRGEYERGLSDHWQGLGKTRNTLAEHIPVWVVLSVVAAVLLLSYSAFRFWLYQISEPVTSQLDVIATPVVTSDQTNNSINQDR